MPSPLAILFLASQLTSVAPDKVPAFDIEHTCQTEGSSVVAPGRCTQDEGQGPRPGSRRMVPVRRRGQGDLY
jgi:hypothetical protein